MLTTPTTKDFQFVLEFLLRGIDPNYALDPTKAKFEDEVIGVFKALGYPFEIRKQALYTVGSPHSWPALVATLTWLIDLLEYSEEVLARKADDCFDADLTFKIFFDYLAKAYGHFLDGEDDSPELDDELSMVFESRNGQVKSEIAQLSDANAELRAQLHALRSAPSPLEHASRQNDDLQSDLGKFKKLVSQMAQHEAQLSAKVGERSADLRGTHDELDAVSAEVESLRAQLAVQELSPADVLRMNGERNRLEGELKCVHGRRAAGARPYARAARRRVAPRSRAATAIHRATALGAQGSDRREGREDVRRPRRRGRRFARRRQRQRVAARVREPRDEAWIAARERAARARPATRLRACRGAARLGGLGEGLVDRPARDAQARARRTQSERALGGWRGTWWLLLPKAFRLSARARSAAPCLEPTHIPTLRAELTAGRATLALCVRAQTTFTAQLRDSQAELLKLQDQVDRSEQAKQVRSRGCAARSRHASRWAALFVSPVHPSDERRTCPDGRCAPSRAARLPRSARRSGSLSLRTPARVLARRAAPHTAQDKEDEIGSLERKAAKLEAIFASEKETLYADVDELGRRSEKKLAEALELRSQLAARRGAAQHALEALQADAEGSRRAFERERDDLYSGLIRTLDRLMGHKEQIRDKLQSALAAGQFAHGAVAAT